MNNASSSPSAPHLFCFGFGYVAHDLARTLKAQGWKISGTTRDPDKRKQMKDEGFSAYLFDQDTPLGDPKLFMKGVTHVLVCAPPNDAGDPAFVLHGDDLLELPDLKWLGYLSSNSVYGDRQGGTVDETTRANPTSKRGSRRIKAEDQWMELCEDGLPVHIFRLAGIYGPGRSAVESMAVGIARRIYKEGHAFSRIHVEDIVKVLIASMNAPKPGEIYNLCDDEAAPSHEVIAHAAHLMGREPPPMIDYEDANLSPMAASFYNDNKRVKNDKIKNDLNITLTYPTYREGLVQCYEAWKEREGDS